MAHGSPILHICRSCNQYIYNPRFSPAPICKCGKKAEQITQEKLRKLYDIHLLDNIVFSFDNWTKVKLR